MDAQLSLPLARNSDPQTSHEAAERVPSFRAKHEAAIFGALHEAGDKGGTYKEIASFCGLEPVQVNRRLAGMCDRGLIERNELGCEYLTPIFEKRGGCCVWRIKK